MKPCLKERRIIEVCVGITWLATLEHRVYSCPDTSDFDFIWGATALILTNKHLGFRVPLEVCAVTKIAANELENLNGLAQPLRSRAKAYLSEVKADQRIIRPGCAHRLYFLNTEPWPLRMQETTASASTTEWSAILSICTDPDQFFQWPQVGALLWPGCVRTQSDGEHKYPIELTAPLAQLELRSDTRTNGPAIVSFLASGGKRPNWGSEGWHIHHIYDGTNGSPHAVRDGSLFTHSAGFVAAHPDIHDLAHKSDLLKWLLWREAFLRFAFDPMDAFIDT
jgi:hypothetical protein